MHTPSHIYKITGATPGPTVCILGGTHGDERASIAVVDRVIAFFELTEKPFGDYHDQRIVGTLYIGYGNPAAIEQNARSVSGEKDLNRCFTNDVIEGKQDVYSPDELRARELSSLLKSIDYCMDIHNTSSPSTSFLASAGRQSSNHMSVYQYVDVDTVLLDPNYILAKHRDQQTNGTTDEYVNNHGGIGFAYETGYQKDFSDIETIYEKVMLFLTSIGTMQDDDSIPSTQQVYALTHSIIANDAAFTYAPDMDRGWQMVEKDSFIGVYENGREVRAPQTGMLLFPKAPEYIKKGHSLCYIAERVDLLVK